MKDLPLFVDPPAAPAPLEIVPPRPMPLSMAPANPEAVIADRVLGDLAAARESIIDWLRPRMLALYRRRLDEQGYNLAFVTTDDARAVLDSEPNFPPPAKLGRQFLGALFRRADGWELTGQFVRSRAAGSHGNLLRCWRWTPLEQRRKR